MASTLTEAIPAHHDMQHEGMEMHHDMDMSADASESQTQHHHGQCHDCFACFGMLPLQLISFDTFKPRAVQSAFTDARYSSHVSPVHHRPPISLV